MYQYERKAGTKETVAHASDCLRAGEARRSRACHMKDRYALGQNRRQASGAVKTPDGGSKLRLYARATIRFQGERGCSRITRTGEEEEGGEREKDF